MAGCRWPSNDGGQPLRRNAPVPLNPLHIALADAPSRASPAHSEAWRDGRGFTRAQSRPATAILAPTSAPPHPQTTLMSPPVVGSSGSDRPRTATVLVRRRAAKFRNRSTPTDCDAVTKTPSGCSGPHAHDAQTDPLTPAVPFSLAHNPGAELPPAAKSSSFRGLVADARPPQPKARAHTT